MNKLKVVKESKTGRNEIFMDTTTKELLTSSQVKVRINSNVPGYNKYYSRQYNGKTTIQRKPDNNKNTNLG